MDKQKCRDVHVLGETVFMPPRSCSSATIVEICCHCSPAWWAPSCHLQKVHRDIGYCWHVSKWVSAKWSNSQQLTSNQIKGSLQKHSISFQYIVIRNVFKRNCVQVSLNYPCNYDHKMIAIVRYTLIWGWLKELADIYYRLLEIQTSLLKAY